MQARIRGSTVEACEVVGAVSDFFDGLGIAHEKADHPLFKQLLKKVQHAPPDWKAPCAETLRSSILDVQHQICVDERICVGLDALVWVQVRHLEMQFSYLELGSLGD